MPKGAKGAPPRSVCTSHMKLSVRRLASAWLVMTTTCNLEGPLAMSAGTKGVGRRGTHSHKSKKTHKLGLRSTFLERHIDQVGRRSQRLSFHPALVV